MKVLVLCDDDGNAQKLKLLIDATENFTEVVIRQSPPHNLFEFLKWDLLVIWEKVGPFYGFEIAAMARRVGFKKKIAIVCSERRKTFNYLVSIKSPKFLQDIVERNA